MSARPRSRQCDLWPRKRVDDHRNSQDLEREAELWSRAPGSALCGGALNLRWLGEDVMQDFRDRVMYGRK